MIINKQILAFVLGLSFFAQCANGQDYFKVFVSSETYDGNLGGITGAAAKCQTLADIAGLGGSFRGWISDSVNGNTLTGTTLSDTFNSMENSYKGFKLVDRQTIIATSWANLTDGTLTNPINMDESGTAVTNNTNVWTYTNSDGTSLGSLQDCQGWTSNSNTEQGVYGDLNSTAEAWTRIYAQDGCGSLNRIYCFQYEVPCEGGYEYNSSSGGCEDVDECSPPTAAEGDGSTGDGVDPPLAPPPGGGPTNYPTPPLPVDPTPPLPVDPPGDVNVEPDSGTGSTGGGFVNPCNLSTSTCKNTVGSYECECLQGYSNTDPFTCVNINECAGTHGCDENSNCVDNNGSFECQCKSGYWVDNDNESYEGTQAGQVECVDIDECAPGGTHDCASVANSTCINTVGSYECECNQGYKYNQTECVNINECATDEDKCDDNSDCLDNDGSYGCFCNEGYWVEKTIYSNEGFWVEKTNNYTGTQAEAGVTCVNINECAGTHGCDNNSTCVDNNGGYKCNCNDGYGYFVDHRIFSQKSYNGGDVGDVECVDIDECTLTEYGTDELLFCNGAAYSGCQNTVGSYKCLCETGYTPGPPDEYNDFTCLDIDECDEGTHGCASVANSTCINTVGSYECECNQGYKYNQIECVNINECVTDEDQCDDNSDCLDNDGSYGCFCKEGYWVERPISYDPFRVEKTNNYTRTQVHEVRCLDINECDEGTHDCASVADSNSNGVCKNTVGSYECGCFQGYEYNSDERTCVNINECVTDEDQCDDNSDCLDNDGSYGCFCKEGYWVERPISYDPFRVEKTNNYTRTQVHEVRCLDINECDEGTHDCASVADSNSNGVCKNTVGSYECGCFQGYEYNSDERTCVNINECATDEDKCDDNSDCLDNDGSYGCFCNEGYWVEKTIYSNEGYWVEKTNNYTGTQADAGVTCVNINECAGTHGCDNNSTCVDNNGGYKCNCNDGYGYFVDHRIFSQKSYNGGDVGDVECVDIDECTLTEYGTDELLFCNGAAYSGCQNTVGSYKCLCETGYTPGPPDEYNDFTCLDIDECDEGTHGCASVADSNGKCINIAGSYECECNQGYKYNQTESESKCVDIDECGEEGEGLYACYNMQYSLKCKNTAGSYECECFQGYEYNTEKMTCEEQISDQPSSVPSESPSVSAKPSSQPSEKPSVSGLPSLRPSMTPSMSISGVPSSEVVVTESTTTTTATSTSVTASPQDSTNAQVAVSVSGTLMVTLTAGTGSGRRLLPRRSQEETSCDVVSISRKDMQEALKKTNCAKFSGNSCTVEISSIDCNTSRRSLFRGVDRGLQAGGVELVVDFITIVTAYCSDKQCSNGSDIADAIYDTVTTTFQESILDNTFADALIAADNSGTFLSSGITIDDVTFSDVVSSVIDQVNEWYPNWLSESHTCLNDGKAPRFMKLNGGYIKDSLKACCDFYYAWNSNCVAEGGGSPSQTDSYLEFYANYMKESCVQSCPEEEDLVVENCGGLVSWWVPTYKSAKECCNHNFNWVNQEKCISQSTTGVESSYKGTYGWYINIKWDACVQDCPKDNGDDCNGPPVWSGKGLLDTKKECCDEYLSWAREECY